MKLPNGYTLATISATVDYPRIGTQSRVTTVPAIGVRWVAKQEIDGGRYSSRCTYRKMSYVYTYTSFAVINKAGNVMTYRGQKGERREWTAPKGWKLAIEDNLVRMFRVASPDIDYHCDGDEILAVNVREVKAKAMANWRLRVEAERRSPAGQLRAAGQSLSDVYVSVADSVRAGNCRAGTTSFAMAHNLSGHVRADVLQSVASTNNRVWPAINTAIVRHLNELRAGVCSLQ